MWNAVTDKFTRLDKIIKQHSNHCIYAFTYFKFCCLHCICIPVRLHNAMHLTVCCGIIVSHKFTIQAYWHAHEVVQNNHCMWNLTQRPIHSFISIMSSTIFVKLLTHCLNVTLRSLSLRRCTMHHACSFGRIPTRADANSEVPLFSKNKLYILGGDVNINKWSE